MTIRLLSRKPVRGGDAVKLTLRLSDGEGNESDGSLLLSFDDYMSLPSPLPEGEISEELFSVLEEKSRRYAALDRALSLLSYGDCSRAALIRKLVQRGHDRESAAEAADRLCREGYIDEFDQIRTLMQQYCREKHYGRRRIQSELLKKGYAREDVQQAFSLFEDGLDYDEAKAACLRRVFGTDAPDLSDPRTRAKYQRTLWQYGF